LLQLRALHLRALHWRTRSSKEIKNKK
jgi:hypothetical protein